MFRKDFVMKPVAVLLSIAGLVAFAGDAAAQFRPSEQNRPAARVRPAGGQTVERSESAVVTLFDDDGNVNAAYAQKVKEERALKAEQKMTGRRAYTGPSHEEIAKAAEQKAVENIKSMLTDKRFALKYGKIGYDSYADLLTVDDVTLVPLKTAPGQKIPPYYFKAQQAVLRGANIGEKEGTPLNATGELRLNAVEIPVWDENAVKKGKVDIALLVLNGNIPAWLRMRAVGRLDGVDVNDLRSETIINEAVLNNVVRSKIFAASSASFRQASMGRDFVDALKRQSLDGLSFVSATIDGKEIANDAGALAAMTSYSARILDSDLVAAARNEAENAKKPDFSKEKLKKNIAENKAARAAVETELKSDL